jgi:hypothetical protein
MTTDQLDLPLVLDPGYGSDAMPVHIARHVMNLYGTITPRIITTRHQLLMSCFTGKDVERITTLNDARDALMNECMNRSAWRTKWR